jgi:hypothetical protein
LEIMREVYAAKKHFSNSGYRSDLEPRAIVARGSEQDINTFEEYLDQAGLKKRMAYYHLEQYDEEKDDLISPEELKKIKQAKQAAKPPKPKAKQIEASIDKTDSMSDLQPPIDKIDNVSNLQEEKKPTAGTPTVAPIGAVSSDKVKIEDVKTEATQTGDQKGALPPDCFAISKSLLMKMLKYEFSNEHIVKILLLVMAESYGLTPPSKYTKMLTEDEIAKAINYPKSRKIKKDITSCIKAGFIDIQIKGENGAAVYFIKKDENLWSDIDDHKRSKEEKKSFVKIKDVYFKKSYEKSIAHPSFGKKEGNLIYMVLDAVGEENALSFLIKYFDETGPDGKIYGSFFGYTLGGFYSQLNKLQMKDGYKNGVRISKITGQEIKDVGF